MPVGCRARRWVLTPLANIMIVSESWTKCFALPFWWLLLSMCFLHLCRGRTCSNFLHWPSPLLPPRGTGMSLLWGGQRRNGDSEGRRHLEVILDSYRNQGGVGACWQQELGLWSSKTLQQRGNSLQDCKQKLQCRGLGRGRCGRDSAGSKAGSSIH